MRKVSELLGVVIFCAIVAFLWPRRTGPAQTAPAKSAPISPGVAASSPEPDLPALLHQVSLDGLKVGMTRQKLVQLWHINNPGPLPPDPDTQFSLQSADGKTEAYVTNQGRVCTILGETLEYQGHRLPCGATKAQLTKLLGTPETVEHYGPRINGTWSYADGCVQAHYNSWRTVNRYELRAIILH